jgi:hypothetical protein
MATIFMSAAVASQSLSEGGFPRLCLVPVLPCSKITEAEAAVSVNEKK